MALVKMTRLTVVALSSDKQKIFDEIVKTGSVQIGECEQIQYDENDNATLEKLLEDISYLENVRKVISDTVTAKNNTLPKDSQITLNDGTLARPRYELSFEQFKNVADGVTDVFERSARVLSLKNKIAETITEKQRLQGEMSALELYLPLEKPISFFKDTSHAHVALGIVPRECIDALCKAVEGEELADIERLGEHSGEILVSLYCHKSLTEFWDSLPKYGFRRAELKSDVLPRLSYAELQSQVATLEKNIEECNDKIVDEVSLYESIKLTVDWLNLSVKEIEAGKCMNNLGHSFVMSAYLPDEDKEKVTTALGNATDNIIMQYDEIGDNDFAPTLCRNNKIVTPFESVTNMYMPPNYHEPDPNPIMSIFYFLIFGLMTADVGYGLLLILGGLGLSALIKQNTGMKQLSGLIGICGFSTVLWGFLFGSCFSADMSTWFGAGVATWYPVLPSPSDYPIITMVLSLILGILHIMAGVVSNAMKQIKQHHVADAIIDNLPWIVFFVGLILLAAQPACGMICDDAYMKAINNGVTLNEGGVIEEGARALQQTHLKALADFNVSPAGKITTNVGLYTIIGALVFVAFTAGRHNKGIFGKIKGGFGGVYGVINYFSDVVSYVRIFGLMLSGAVFGAIINQIVNQMLFPIGIVGYVAGAVILALFHVFNLALAVLGAYVHNARLQYVEYFGKFYEGEGVLFTPLGSDLTYTLIKH